MSYNLVKYKQKNKKIGWVTELYKRREKENEW